MDKVIKYYVWKGNVRFTEVAFDDIDEIYLRYPA